MQAKSSYQGWEYPLLSVRGFDHHQIKLADSSCKILNFDSQQSTILSLSILTNNRKTMFKGSWCWIIEDPGALFPS